MTRKEHLLKVLPKIEYELPLKDLNLILEAMQAHTDEQLILSGVSGSAFKDELFRKTESMIWFARKNYKKEYYEGVLNAMRNLQVHINKIYKKHYR